eukprot:TRINITY_DN7411_c0_g1_i1.p2 TRINITY_DN7411_c0_g1~~TRINITY_DN7411_c0_g1_i1.p2  ORF type:complete len:141 (-),score=10.38 TRINITY_DN7411_c0_g1_i1:163-585(-)
MSRATRRSYASLEEKLNSVAAAHSARRRTELSTCQHFGRSLLLFLLLRPSASSPSEDEVGSGIETLEGSSVEQAADTDDPIASVATAQDGDVLLEVDIDRLQLFTGAATAFFFLLMTKGKAVVLNVALLMRGMDTVACLV